MQLRRGAHVAAAPTPTPASTAPLVHSSAITAPSFVAWADLAIASPIASPPPAWVAFGSPASSWSTASSFASVASSPVSTPVIATFASPAAASASSPVASPTSSLPTVAPPVTAPRAAVGAPTSLPLAVTSVAPAVVARAPSPSWMVEWTAREEAELAAIQRELEYPSDDDEDDDEPAVVDAPLVPSVAPIAAASRDPALEHLAAFRALLADDSPIDFPQSWPMRKTHRFMTRGGKPYKMIMEPAYHFWRNIESLDKIEEVEEDE